MEKMTKDLNSLIKEAETMARQEQYEFAMSLADELVTRYQMKSEYGLCEHICIDENTIMLRPLLISRRQSKSMKIGLRVSLEKMC